MIGQKVIRLDSINSTNDYIKTFISNNKGEEGTVVLALEQTQGRGQMGNRWESNKGENLTFSFILFPDFIEAHEQFLISKFVSLAIFDLLNTYNERVKIKWPNDIYVADKKIAGILIENIIKGTVISNSIIGIGLNVNQKQFGPLLPLATSLSIETKQEFQLDLILEQLLEKLNHRYKQFKQGLEQFLNKDYINALYRYREFHEFQSGNTKFIAQITDIDEDGRLCLLTKKNELLKFAFKEVHFL